MSKPKDKSVRLNKVTLTHANQAPREFLIPGESAAQVEQTLAERLPHHKVTAIPQGRGRVVLEPTSYDIDDVEFNIERDGDSIVSFSLDNLRNTHNEVTHAVKKAALSFLKNTCAKQLGHLQTNLEQARRDSPDPADHPEWYQED